MSFCSILNSSLILHQLFSLFFLGAYGPEVHQKMMAKVNEKKIKKDAAPEDKISQWRRGDKTKKSKYIVKTMEEVLNKGELPGRKREFKYDSFSYFFL